MRYDRNHNKQGLFCMCGGPLTHADWYPGGSVGPLSTPLTTAMTSNLTRWVYDTHAAVSLLFR